MSLSREEIIHMAREAGFLINGIESTQFLSRIEYLANAAYAAGAAAEREPVRYVPMTDDEITEATQVMKSNLLHEPTLYCWKQVEAAIIRRAGLEVQE